jgi:hypothetical protein
MILVRMMIAYHYRLVSFNMKWMRSRWSRLTKVSSKLASRKSGSPPNGVVPFWFSALWPRVEICASYENEQQFGSRTLQIVIAPPSNRNLSTSETPFPKMLVLMLIPLLLLHRVYFGNRDLH